MICHNAAVLLKYYLEINYANSYQYLMKDLNFYIYFKYRDNRSIPNFIHIINQFDKFFLLR